MDKAERLALPHPECEARNLFVRESRTHRYFLLTAHARVDLKAFSRQQLRSLSFASADELREILWLETGAVTPLVLLNAPDVTLYLDEALLGGRIASHEHQHRHGVGCRRPILSACFAHNATACRPSPSLSGLIHPLYLENAGAQRCARRFLRIVDLEMPLLHHGIGDLLEARDVQHRRPGCSPGHTPPATIQRRPCGC